MRIAAPIAAFVRSVKERGRIFHPVHGAAFDQAIGGIAVRRAGQHVVAKDIAGRDEVGRQVILAAAAIVVVELGGVDHAGGQLPGATEGGSDGGVVSADALADQLGLHVVVPGRRRDQALLGAALEQDQLTDVVKEASEEAVLRFGANRFRQQSSGRR